MLDASVGRTSVGPPRTTVADANVSQGLFFGHKPWFGYDPILNGFPFLLV
jgi:hypothetical protein